MLICGERPFGENSAAIVATGQFRKPGKAVLDTDLKYTFILSPMQQRTAQDNHCRERYCVVAWLTALAEAVSNSVSILQGQSSQYQNYNGFSTSKGLLLYIFILCYVLKKSYNIYSIQVLCQIYKML